jgi:hypothetical protein
MTINFRKAAVRVLTAAGLSVALSSVTVSAANLGLNFASTDPDAATSSLLPTDSAGVVPQVNWNNFALNNGASVPPIILDNGAVSTATVSWASNNTWRSGGNSAFPAGTGDRKLMSGYLDTLDTTVGGISLTVSNIDAALRSPAYDVYVYFLGDSSEARRGGGYTINDGSGPITKFGSTMGTPSAHIEDPGTDTDNTLDGTYLRFAGLTGASFTLTSDATLTTPPGFANGFRAPINGIQIVQVPEPGTFALIGVGTILVSAGIALRRRNRA